MTNLKARTELEQELVSAFIDAVDFDKVGAIFSKYGARAALTGTSLVAIITKNAMINCGWPGPELNRALGIHESAD